MEEILDNQIKKSIRSLEKMFAIKVKTPTLKTVKTREEFNKETNRSKTQSWMVAHADFKQNKIVIFQKDLIEKNSKNHKNEEYETLILHELVHFFIKGKYGDSIPLWIHEGLACNIAGQKKKKVEISFLDMIRLSSIKNFHKDKLAYPKSYWLVKNAIEKEGGLEKWLKDLKHQ